MSNLGSLSHIMEDKLKQTQTHGTDVSLLQQIKGCLQDSLLIICIFSLIGNLLASACLQQSSVPTKSAESMRNTKFENTSLIIRQCFHIPATPFPQTSATNSLCVLIWALNTELNMVLMALLFRNISAH